MTVEPGLYEMAIEDYHADPCPEPSLNNSLIASLLQAPAKARARHPRLNGLMKPEESRRMDLGSVAHKLLLGRGRDIDRLYFRDYRTNDAKAARDKSRAEGRIPVLEEDYLIAENMHTAAMKQLGYFGLDHAFLEGGQSEVAMLWQDAAGCWGRCLIDRLLNERPTWELWDYKTTDRSARPDDAGLGAHVVDMGYDTQCAMQERGLVHLFPALAGRLKFRLLFQETDEPYLISVVEPDEATMTMARKKVDYALNKWAECLRSEIWPGYTPKIVPLSHAPYLAERWLAREVAEMGEELPPPELPKRKRGRQQGSRGRDKRVILFQLRQMREEDRERQRQAKLRIIDGGQE